MQGTHIPDTGHDMRLASACLNGEAVLCAPTRTNMEHCHSTWTWKTQRARTALKTGKACLAKTTGNTKRTQTCHIKNPPRNPVAKTITITAERTDRDTGRESRKGTRRNLVTTAKKTPTRTWEAASDTGFRDACQCIILQESCIKMHHVTTAKRRRHGGPAPDSDPVPGAGAGRETMPKTPAGRLRTSVTNPV